MQNWAGNVTYAAARVERPGSVEELAAVVAGAPRVRAVGTRHCFNDIADSPGGVLVSLEKLDRVLAIRSAGPRPAVVVEGGITYGQLGPVLHAAGLAVPNLASLPHIAVAGACATATHGSGETNGGLATSVAAMELVTADGAVRSIARGDADFDAGVVHLGALGIVTKLTLDVVPTFEIAQHVYERVPAAAFLEQLDAIAASAYSVSVFMDWQTDAFNQVWMKCVPDRPHFDLRSMGGIAATRPRHPLDGRAGNVASEGAGADAATRQLGQPGPWHERLPHFRPEFTPSSGEEIQSEYFVPRSAAAAAVEAVSGLREAIDPLLQISEIRFVAADGLWLSPFYDRPTVALHFTWRKKPAALAALLPRLEAALAPLAARPHWGKVFTLPGETLRTLYPKFDAFRQVRAAFDPSGKFHNPYLARCGF